MIIFGVNVAYINECKGDYSFYSYDYFRLVFNYPNFSEEEGWHTGYFVDANTIILIRKFGDSTYYRLTRTR